MTQTGWACQTALTGSAFFGHLRWVLAHVWEICTLNSMAWHGMVSCIGCIMQGSGLVHQGDSVCNVVSLTCAALFFTNDTISSSSTPGPHPVDVALLATLSLPVSPLCELSSGMCHQTYPLSQPKKARSRDTLKTGPAAQALSIFPTSVLLVLSSYICLAHSKGTQARAKPSGMPNKH